jgi:hypothetical protein
VVRRHGSNDDRWVRADIGGSVDVGRNGDTGPVTDAEFRREWERHFLLSVRAATLEVVQSSTWLSESEARVALEEALRRRGIYPDPDAVADGAALISRGRRPKILDLELDKGSGRRRRG